MNQPVVNEPTLNAPFIYQRPTNDKKNYTLDILIYLDANCSILSIEQDNNAPDNILQFNITIQNNSGNPQPHFELTSCQVFENESNSYNRVRLCVIDEDSFREIGSNTVEIKDYNGEDLDEPV